MAKHIILLEPGTREFIALIKDIDERTPAHIKSSIADALSDHFDFEVFGDTSDEIIKEWSNKHNYFIDGKIEFTDEEGHELSVIVERGFIY